MAEKKESLLEARKVSKWFGADASKIVLSKLDFSVRKGEFVALIGPSGSGKSTFLRILAGLLPPSEGDVFVKGKALTGTNPDVAIVFQNFALYPWLTIEKNVEIGLIANDLSREVRKEKVAEAIHLIGLDGFEQSYPKAISGGMKQRVGFARAIIVQPEILLMDEPFSALDVLTALNLRHEFSSLWHNKKFPIDAILMVTHNIEEAVSMADRIIVLSSNPGQIRIEIPGLPVEQRDNKNANYTRLVDNIYQVMTNPTMNPEKLIQNIKYEQVIGKPSYQILPPKISIGKLRGFLKQIEWLGDNTDMNSLGNTITMDDMFPLIEFIGIMGFGGIEGKKIVLTKAGKEFANAHSDKAREIFRKQAISFLPLVSFIMDKIENSPDKKITTEDVLIHLNQYFNEEDAQLQLEAVIRIGRYSKLFTVDGLKKYLILSNIDSKDKDRKQLTVL